MEKERPTLYELSRDFWNFCFENPDLAKPNEIALYFFILEHNNRLGWKTKFGLPASMAMEALSIKSPNTYNKSLNNLVDWGFINMISKSKNQWSSCVVAVLKFKSARKSALDTALIQHGSRHEYGSDSIDKQIYKYTSIQERDENSPENLFDNFKNKLELDLDSCFENVISNVLYLETISMNYHFPNIEITKQWIELFFKKLQNEGVSEKSISDFKSHFARWLNIEIKNKNGNKKSSGLSSEEEQREFLNAVASGIARAEHERNIAV